MKNPRIGAFAVALGLALGGAGTALADDEVMELPDLEVTGLSQELGLRAIKAALDTPRSNRAEDLDKLTCWFDKKTGSHMMHLYCATNRVLRDAGDYSAGLAGGPSSGQSSAALDGIRSWRVDRTRFEKALERLGPEKLNREILHRALKGEALPDNVPDLEELGRFTAAMAPVRAVAGEYDPRIARASGAEREKLIAESDAMMARAIEDAGLSVERYNEISELVSRYESLQGMVRERLADSGR